MRLFLFLLLFTPLFSSSQCLVKNTSFEVGEKLSYQVYYNWGFIWMNVGQAYFKVDTTTISSQKVYKFHSYGATYPRYDWMYKVRDTYKSIADRETLLPISFMRDIYEGGTKTDVSNIFDYDKKLIYNYFKQNEDSAIIDTLKLSPCVFDVLTAVYYARNIDFSKRKINEKIPFTIILDNEIFNLYVRYLGKETIETKSNKIYNCIKFKPLLVDGTIFSGGEEMTVWVTNNKSKIPILVEAEVIVGSVKIYLSDYKNLINE